MTIILEKVDEILGNTCVQINQVESIRPLDAGMIAIKREGRPEVIYSYVRKVRFA